MTAYKLVDKSCFINVSARLDPIEGYRGEEGPPPKLLSSRGFRGFRGSRPPLKVTAAMAKCQKRNAIFFLHEDDAVASRKARRIWRQR